MAKLSIKKLALLIPLAFLLLTVCTSAYATEASQLKITAIPSKGGLAYVSSIDDIVFTDVETGDKIEYATVYFMSDGIVYPVTGVEVITKNNGIVNFISEERVDNKIAGRAFKVYGSAPSGTTKIEFRTAYKLEDGKLILLKSVTISEDGKVIF